MGHEDAFLRPRLSARCWFSQGTFGISDISHHLVALNLESRLITDVRKLWLARDLPY